MCSVRIGNPPAWRGIAVPRWLRSLPRYRWCRSLRLSMSPGGSGSLTGGLCRAPSGPACRVPPPASRFSRGAPARRVSVPPAPRSDVAGRLGPKRQRVFQPTRTLPPISAACVISASWCLPAPSTDHRCVAEQLVGDALHVHQAFRIRTDAAQDSEHELQEDRTLDQSAIDEVLPGCTGGRRRSTRTRSVPCRRWPSRSNTLLDIRERVAEDRAARAFDEVALPRA